MTTPASPASRKSYQYFRVSVYNARGQLSTISISPPDFEQLAKLAAESSLHPTLGVKERVYEVCRDAARAVLAKGYTGKLSVAVRIKARQKLRGSYRKAKAVAVAPVAAAADESAVS
jgi:hypothetical protein